MFVEKCNALVDTRFYIFGACYNTQYLLALGLDSSKILGILDNCKEKQCKYLYGYDIKIYDPSVIKHTNCSIILKSGYYSNEILKQILSINPYANVLYT